MLRRKIITIGGMIGSGKSTVARILAEKLGYQHFSGGDYMRMMAQEREVSFEELHKMAEEDPTIDQEIDRRQQEFFAQHDHIVVDSRLGFYWVPEAFHVILTLDPEVAAKRVFADMQNNPLRSTEKTVTIEDAKKAIEARATSNQIRYQKLYGIENYCDTKHFDFIIDTEHINQEKVAQKIITEYEKWYEAGHIA